MKNFCFFIFLLIFGFIASVSAEETSGMVKVENYFSTPLLTVGLVDYPPFSRYVSKRKNSSMLDLESALLQPTIDVLKKHGINIVPQLLTADELDPKMLTLAVRSGKYHLYIGAYSNTHLYKGLQLIFPASIANPIHLITIKENTSNIKNRNELKNLRGVMSKTEQISDFIAQQIKELGVEYVDTPYEGYEKLIMGDADYMLGGLYYNRMMASHYGLGSFLAYSHQPLFKIPLFIAISKVTPRLSQYMEIFQEEFSKPDYANAVKKEILRLVTEEEKFYAGAVPPSFARHNIEDKQEEYLDVDDDVTVNSGHIIEQQVKERSIDDVLEGI